MQYRFESEVKIVKDKDGMVEAYVWFSFPPEQFDFNRGPTPVAVVKFAEPGPMFSRWEREPGFLIYPSEVANFQDAAVAAVKRHLKPDPPTGFS